MSTCTGTSDENKASSHNLEPVHQCEVLNVNFFNGPDKLINTKMSRPNYLPMTATYNLYRGGFEIYHNSL